MGALLRAGRYSQKEWEAASPAVYDALRSGVLKETEEPGFLMYGQICKTQIKDLKTGDRFRVTGWQTGRTMFVDVMRL